MQYTIPDLDYEDNTTLVNVLNPSDTIQVNSGSTTVSISDGALCSCDGSAARVSWRLARLTLHSSLSLFSTPLFYRRAEGVQAKGRLDAAEASLRLV